MKRFSWLPVILLGASVFAHSRALHEMESCKAHDHFVQQDLNEGRTPVLGALTDRGHYYYLSAWIVVCWVIFLWSLARFGQYYKHGALPGRPSKIYEDRSPGAGDDPFGG